MLVLIIFYPSTLFDNRKHANHRIDRYLYLKAGLTSVGTISVTTVCIQYALHLTPGP